MANCSLEKPFVIMLAQLKACMFFMENMEIPLKLSNSMYTCLYSNNTIQYFLTPL